MIITGSNPQQCWKRFELALIGYWGRLQVACDAQGVIANQPIFQRDQQDQTCASYRLGNQSAILHVDMSTSEEVTELMENCRKESLVIGNRPQILVMGFQKLQAVKNPTAKADVAWELHAYDYKYTLLCRTDGSEDWSDSFALRIESEAKPGMNSWLLNHPVHHLQFGEVKNLRFESAGCRSMISVVDWVLRSIHPEVWGELYPELYRALAPGAQSYFAMLNNPAHPQSLPISALAQEMLEALLQEAKGNQYDWFFELKQWYQDTADWAIPVPELIHCFSDPKIFASM